MHLTAFRVLYFVAACGISSSKFGFYCGFLFNSPHDISRPAIRSCEYLIFTIRANIRRIVRILLMQFGKGPLKVLYTDFIAVSGIFALL